MAFRVSGQAALLLLLVCLCTMQLTIGSRLKVSLQTKTAAPTDYDNPDEKNQMPPGQTTTPGSNTPTPSPNVNYETDPLSNIVREPNKEQWADETLDSFLKRILPQTKDISGVTISKTPNSIAIVSNDNIVLNPTNYKEERRKRFEVGKQNVEEQSTKGADEGKFKSENEGLAKRAINDDLQRQRQLEEHKNQIMREVEKAREAANQEIEKEMQTAVEHEDGYLCDCKDVPFANGQLQCPDQSLIHSLHRKASPDNLQGLDGGKCCHPCQREGMLLKQVSSCQSHVVDFSSEKWVMCQGTDTFLRGFTADLASCPDSGIECILTFECCKINVKEVRNCKEENWNSMGLAGWSDLLFNHLLRGVYRGPTNNLSSIIKAKSCGFSAH